MTLSAEDVFGDCPCKSKLSMTYSACDADVMKEYIRDNKCQDATNTPECFYDGGDCCRPTSYKGLPGCIECKCHEPVSDVINEKTTPISLTNQERNVDWKPVRWSLNNPFKAHDYAYEEDYDYDDNWQNFQLSKRNLSILGQFRKPKSQFEVMKIMNWF